MTFPASHEQMIMICHEAIGVHLEIRSVGSQDKSVEENRAINVVLKNIPMIRASVHNVMPRTGEVCSGRTRH
jgi:hypothetical protein